MECLIGCCLSDRLLLFAVVFLHGVSSPLLLALCSLSAWLPEPVSAKISGYFFSVPFSCFSLLLPSSSGRGCALRISPAPAV